MPVLVMKNRTIDSTPPASLAPGELALYLGNGTVKIWAGDAQGVPYAYGTGTTGFVQKSGDTMTGNLVISNGQPTLIWDETDGAAGVKRWGILNAASSLLISPRDDAGGPISNGGNMTFTRDAAGLLDVRITPTGLATVPSLDSLINARRGDARYLTLIGGTLTGFLTLHAAPTAALHAATKGYVDTLLAGYSNIAAADARYVNVTGDTMTAALTLPGTDPTATNHATRKAYVDAQVATRLTQAAADARYAPTVHTHTEAQVTDLNRLRWRGDWAAGMTIATNDLVSKDGIIYLAVGVPSAAPPSGNWRVFGKVGSGVLASDTPPVAPTPGDLWFRTLTPVGLFVWYVDPNSSQWVATDQASALAAGFVMNTGGAMSGHLSLMAGNPTLPEHAARKAYVDTQVATRLTQAQADGLYMSAFSDSGMKDYIRPLPPEEATAKVQTLKPKTFQWVNPNGVNRHAGTSYGLIAQEVAGTIPSASVQSGGMFGIDGLEIISLLVGAVQHLNTRITELENG